MPEVSVLLISAHMRLFILSSALGALIVSSSLTAQIHILEVTAESSVRATGGGGGTPITDGPRGVGVSNPEGVVLTQSASASGPANDGLGVDRGAGSGSSSTQITILVDDIAEISGAGGTSADFLATPDLGAGQGICRVSASIIFVVESDEAYTFVAEASGNVGSTDSIKLKRLQPPLAPTTLHFAFSLQNVDTIGTLSAGTYEIELSFESGVSGGSAQESSSVADAFSFALDFTEDPLVESDALANFGTFKIVDYFFSQAGDSFLTFDATSGASYRVLTSDNLIPSWDLVPNTSLTTESAGRFTIALPNFDEPKRFFRVERL